MAQEALIEAFPRRPIEIRADPKRDKTRRIGLIVLVLLLLPGLYWGWALWQDQQKREYLRANGVQAEVLDAQGSCWSRRQITGDNPRGCNLDIRYQLQPEHGGEVREADVWLDGRQPIFTPPALYDPADPDRVMLKPEAERDLRWSEWIGVPFALAIPLAGLLLWAFGRRGGLVDALKAPRPVTVPVNRMVRRGDILEVAFQRPDKDKEALQLFAENRMPFLLHPPPEANTDKPWALAVLAPTGRPILLDSELADLELSAAERAALFGRP